MQEEIKKLLDDNCIIVFDTNVYLHIYMQSPEYIKFILKCLEKIKSKMYIPYIVSREIERHHRKIYREQKKKYEELGKKIKFEIENNHKNIINKCESLNSLKFPNIDKLKNELCQKNDEILNCIDEYLLEHDVLEKMNESLFKDDFVKEFIDCSIGEEKVFLPPTAEDILNWQENYDMGIKNKDSGEMSDPGSKDKGKKNSNMYHDKIIWEEIRKFCKLNDKSCILVTDDTKEDWFEKENNEKVFRKDLIKNFNKNTKKDIIGISSTDFYINISNIYEIENKDMIKYSMEAIAEEYDERSIDEYEITLNALYDVVLDPYRYINEEDSEGIGYEKFEIDDSKYTINFVNLDYNIQENVINYYLEYELDMKAVSYEYAGKDDETKEIFLSPPIYHDITIKMTVLVTKVINNYIDLKENFNEEIEVIDKQIIIKNAIPEMDLCYSCRENEGIIFGEEGKVYCEKCAIVNEDHDICPKCGKVISNEDMAGTGFCMNCENEELVSNR